MPLANTPLNVPPKTRLSQWSVKNTGGDPKKITTYSHSHSKMAEPRLDAHHTVGLPPTVECSWNCHVSAEDSRHVLPLPDQCVKNKTDVYPRQNMQYETSYSKANFNQMHNEYGSVQSTVHNIQNVENCSHQGGSSEQHHNQFSSACDNQLEGTSESCARGYCLSSAEQGKVLSERTTENRYLKCEKTSVCSAVNSRDMNTAVGHRYLETCTTLPRSQTIKRSSSMIQPKPDFSKPCVSNTSHDSVKPLHNRKLPQRTMDNVSGFIRPGNCDVNTVTVRRPYVNVNTRDFCEESGTNQCVLEDGKQIHDYQTYTSQLKCNQNHVGSNIQKERDPFRRSGSLECSKSGSQKPTMTTVLEPLQPSEIGEIWKKVVLAR